LKRARGQSQSPAANLDQDEGFRQPVPSFPDGMKILHPCEDATVDICFVHGLTGNCELTWTARGQKQSWPELLLPVALKKARILTYGYDAYVLRASVASSNRLIDHSKNLLIDLVQERASSAASSRPIIFIAHSLGGLVCKYALLISRNKAEPHLKGISKCTRGVLLMGTPHTGSWMADWAKIPASGLGLVKSTNKSLLKILETDDQLLESIQIEFLSMVRDQSHDKDGL
jgi:pimeloyl-ACP methyl ester carboxylesterase